MLNSATNLQSTTLFKKETYQSESRVTASKAHSTLSDEDTTRLSHPWFKLIAYCG